MTAADHAAEAELLLQEGCEYGCPHSGCEHERGHLTRAQVHATLAVARQLADIAQLLGGIRDEIKAAAR